MQHLGSAVPSLSDEVAKLLLMNVTGKHENAFSLSSNRCPIEVTRYASTQQHKSLAREQSVMHHDQTALLQLGSNVAWFA